MALVVGVLGSRGPFGEHPVLAYDQFLTDFQAGRVGQVTQWRDQLEVSDSGQLWSVTVPPDRDVLLDLGPARFEGGVGINYGSVPDPWLTTTAPLVPAAFAVAGLVVWVTAMRGAGRGATMGRDVLSSG